MTTTVAVFKARAAAQGGAPEAKVFRLNKERVVVGSVVSADVRLSGEGVAPIHAVIEISAGAAVVYDLASASGIHVNGAKTVTAPLKPGDELRVGPWVIDYSLQTVEVTSAQAPFRERGGRRLFFDPKENMGALLLQDEREVEDIFDYRPTQEKRAVEVVMSWRETILDVRHFVHERRITLGNTRGAHFAIPPLLSAARFPLVVRAGDGNYRLTLDSRMTGVLQSGGGPKGGSFRTLEEARAAGSGARGATGVEILFGENDFAKISVGEVDFYVSFTAAPPRLKRRGVFQRDALLFKTVSVSAAISAFLIGTILSTEVPRDLETEELPERIVTILYQPEKYMQSLRRPAPAETKPLAKEDPKKSQPTPTKTVKVEIEPGQAKPNQPVPERMNVGPAKQAARQKTAAVPKPRAGSPQKGGEGQGARAKGSEGARGKPTAKDQGPGQVRAQRPSPQGGTGAGAGASQVRADGNADLLKGAGQKLLNILGNSGAKLGASGKKLEGFGGFTTQGPGGLALSGGGKGGGGTAESLGGLSDKGVGGGAVGTGLGAEGTGNLIGGRVRVDIRAGGNEETVVMGSIDRAAIEAAILAHRDEFRLCYEREINAGTPSLSGRVTPTFVIGSGGRVTEAAIKSSSLGNVGAEKCVLSVIRRIQFPIPEGAGIVQVSYPFRFRSTGGG